MFSICYKSTNILATPLNKSQGPLFAHDDLILIRLKDLWDHFLKFTNNKIMFHNSTAPATLFVLPWWSISVSFSRAKSAYVPDCCCFACVHVQVASMSKVGYRCVGGLVLCLLLYCSLELLLFAFKPPRVWPLLFTLRLLKIGYMFFLYLQKLVKSL